MMEHKNIKFDKEDLIRRTNENHKKYPVDKGVSVIRDISYGSVDNRKLYGDIYTPEEIPKEPRPAIVFVHGGSWMVGDKVQFCRQASYLSKKYNFLSLCINYRFSEEARYPAAVEDVKCAVRWIRSQSRIYNIDKKRVAVSGGSAGAHLSAMAALTADEKSGGDWKDYRADIDLLVLFNGEYDLVDVVEKESLLEQMRVFLGNTYDKDPEIYREASPINRLHSSMPPTLFLHGTDDTCVSHKQSIDMHNEVKKMGIHSEIELYKGKPHAWFNHADDYRQTLERMEMFLKEQFNLDESR